MNADEVIKGLFDKENNLPKTTRQKATNSVKYEETIPALENEEWTACRYCGKWHRQGAVGDTIEECDRSWERLKKV